MRDSEREARVRQAVQDYQERKGSAFFGKNPKPPEGRGSNTNRPLRHVTAK